MPISKTSLILDLSWSIPNRLYASLAVEGSETTTLSKAEKPKGDITDIISSIGEEINSVLNTSREEQYFYGIILLYSLIENLLKWLVYLKILWDKSRKKMSVEEAREIQSFCKGLTFYEVLRIGISTDVINFRLYKEIDNVRSERNDVVHQLWIYEQRKNFLVLRKKLEEFSRIANELIGIFNRLTGEITVDEVYEIFLAR